MSGGSAADGCSVISLNGTRTWGWTLPAAKTLRDAGSESETTVSGTALIVDAPRAVGPRKTQRSRREKANGELSYASMNWIRFEGRHAAPYRRHWPLSPLAGLP